MTFYICIKIKIVAKTPNFVFLYATFETFKSTPAQLI